MTTPPLRTSCRTRSCDCVLAWRRSSIATRTFVPRSSTAAETKPGRRVAADAGLRRIGVGAEVSSTDQPSELLDVVARLSYKQRVVLVLRYWADLPEGEIAEIVGARPATVRSINARALARLSKELPR